MSKIATSTAVLLAVGMLITGSINTLSTKWADKTYSWGRYTYDQYNHPFVQAFGMFIGEALCLLAFTIINWRLSAQGRSHEIERATGDYKFYIFALPACCDMLGTSLMYLGLNYTAASTFQMLRGSVVIFTGIFSVLFLGRKLRPFHWLGMLLVLGGLAAVGIASILYGNSNEASKPVLGDTLVIVAQLVAATQMVVEEKLLDKYKVPALQAVGMEGVFGMFFMFWLLIIFQNVPGLPGSPDTAHFEDTLDAFHRLGNSWRIMLATMGNIFSIAFFNFFGLSVTKHLSATTRMVLDSIRTLVVWGVDLALGWEEFQYLQIIGFVFLLLGTAVYNKIVPVPFGVFDYKYWDAIEAEEDLNTKLLSGSEQPAGHAIINLHGTVRDSQYPNGDSNGQYHNGQYYPANGNGTFNGQY